MTRAEREKIRREINRVNRAKLLAEGRPEPYATPNKKRKELWRPPGGDQTPKIASWAGGDRDAK